MLSSIGRTWVCSYTPHVSATAAEKRRRCALVRSQDGVCIILYGVVLTLYDMHFPPLPPPPLSVIKIRCWSHGVVKFYVYDDKLVGDFLGVQGPATLQGASVHHHSEPTFIVVADSDGEYCSLLNIFQGYRA